MPRTPHSRGAVRSLNRPGQLLWSPHGREIVRAGNDANHAAVLLAYFGADCDVRGLTESDQQAFVTKRLAGGIVLPAEHGKKKRITSPVRRLSG